MFLDLLNHQLPMLNLPQKAVQSEERIQKVSSFRFNTEFAYKFCRSKCTTELNWFSQPKSKPTLHEARQPLGNELSSPCMLTGKGKSSGTNQAVHLYHKEVILTVGSVKLDFVEHCRD